MIRALFAGFAAVMAATVLAPAPVSAQEAKTLVIGCYGGVFTEVQKKFAADLFTERTGIKVEFVDASPKTHLAKLIAAKGRTPPYDIVYMDDDVRVEAADAGVLMKLDPKLVPNLAQIYPEARSPEGYGPAYAMGSIGIAFNPEKLKAAGIPEPTSWNDLWDPKLAGRVSVPSIDNITGRVFIEAAARLNGGGIDDLSKGVQKIATIKAHSYYISSTDLQAKFESGEVWVAPWINGRAWGMTVRGKPVRYIMPKEGGYANFGMIDVVAGSKNAEAAQTFINFLLDPFPEMAQAYELSYGPSNMLLAPVLKQMPELARMFPSTPEELAKLNQIDWRKYSKQYPKLLQEWNRSIMGK